MEARAVALIAPDVSSNPGDQSELLAPAMIVYGTSDKPCDLDIQYQYHVVYNDVGSLNKHLVVISGANHFGYTDGICIDDSNTDPPSTVGGATDREAHTRQQQTARNYVDAFYALYLQDDSGAARYLVQEGEQQCNADDPSTHCDPPPNCGRPQRSFEDLEDLNVEVGVCSCLE